MANGPTARDTHRVASLLLAPTMAIWITASLTACDGGDAEMDDPPAAEVRGGQALLRTEPDGVYEEVEARLRIREQARRMPPPAVSTADLLAEFNQAREERKIEIIASLGASAAPDAWSFLLAQAADGPRSIRLAAFDALAVHAGGDPAPAIRHGLASDDVEIRAMAATLLGRQAKDPTLWAAAAVDPSPDVRVSYHAAIPHTSSDIQLHAAKVALASGDPQLRREGAAVAGTARTKDAADLLIPLLQDPHTGEIAADGLFYFFGRYFEDSAEAQSWWLANREQFTDNLLAK